MKNNYEDQYSYNNNATYENDPYAVKAEPQKKSGIGSKLIITALCCSLLGGAAGAGGTMLGLKAFGNDAVQTSSTAQAEADSGNSQNKTTIVNGSRSDAESKSDGITQTKVDTSKLMTASEVYKANVNATVGITTSITSTNYWGYQTEAAASGSGFIISSDGYIITNHHVIEGANSITVTTYDGTTYDAELVGSDESNDIAVLKIDAADLETVVLGSSDSLEVGDNVVAIGNPLGELTFSLTSGVVSALDRTITTTEHNTMNLIQTDCAINSGNSGGALFNMYGEVVGITNAKYSSNGMTQASIDNIGFAIPIDSVRSIINNLIEKGYIMKPYIGVGLADVSSDSIELGLPKGAAVKKVYEDSPAEEAGIQTGDIITAADDKKITSSADLIAMVRKASAGDKMTLTVYRKGETIEITVTVDEKKQENEKEAAQEQQQQQQQEQYGGWEDFGFPDIGRMFGY